MTNKTSSPGLKCLSFDCYLFTAPAHDCHLRGWLRSERRLRYLHATYQTRPKVIIFYVNEYQSSTCYCKPVVHNLFRPGATKRSLKPFGGQTGVAT